jgi:hypothetical protein
MELQLALEGGQNTPIRTTITLQKFKKLWTVSNSSKIVKNRLEQSPDDLF